MGTSWAFPRETRATSLLLRNFARRGNDSFDSLARSLYALGVRWFLLSGMLWSIASFASAQPLPAAGTCLGGNCEVGAPVRQQEDLPRRRSAPTPGLARGAAWFGLLSGALSLGGSIAIASLNDREHEPITRGVWVGYTTLAVPLVAIGSYVTRKRARVEGVSGLRIMGWSAYLGAVSNGAAQWYLVLVDVRPTPGFTIGVGVIGLMSFLPHAFYAYVSGRAARSKRFARITPTTNGLAVRF